MILGSIVGFLRFTEWHAECLEKRTALIICVCGSYKDEVKAKLTLNLIKLDLRENGLIVNAQRIVTTTIKALGCNTTEVTNIGCRDVDETVQRIPTCGCHAE